MLFFGFHYLYFSNNWTCAIDITAAGLYYNLTDVNNDTVCLRNWCTVFMHMKFWVILNDV